MEKTSLLVIGATCAGVGLAMKRPDAIILEESTLIGSEFIASMNIKPCVASEFLPEAQELKDQCRKIKAMDENGRIHFAAVQSLLAERAYESGAEFRFCSPLVELRRCADGWLVRWLDCEGMHTMLAEQVVDTRDVRGGQKGICVMLNEGDGQIPGVQETNEILWGAWKGECVLKWKLPFETSWIEARRVVHEGMKEIQQRKLVSIAPVFCYDFVSPIMHQAEPGYFLSISASYPDVISALNGGIVCATALS